MEELITLDDVVFALAVQRNISITDAGQIVHDIIQEQISHTMVYLAGNLGSAMDAIDTPQNSEGA